MELTERERIALSFIVDMQRTKGYPPSVRELLERLDCTSPATAKHVLDSLVVKGRIERGPGPRQITVLRA